MEQILVPNITKEHIAIILIIVRNVLTPTSDLVSTNYLVEQIEELEGVVHFISEEAN